jgi:hypothetical protein
MGGPHRRCLGYRPRKPDLIFTMLTHEGWPLRRLATVDAERLSQLVTDAGRTRADPRSPAGSEVAATILAQNRPA